MIARLLNRLSSPAVASVGVDPSQLPNYLSELNRDPYLRLTFGRLNILSVFDDLTYDRSDIDFLAPAMRNHAFRRLKALGFRQISGRMLDHSAGNIRVIAPKFHALGASPFDIARYTPKRDQDFYVLTPTQMACQIIDHYPHGEAVERVKSLISKQPINLFRLADYLERKPAHQAFANAIGHLRYFQKVAVASEPLRRRRALA